MQDVFDNISFESLYNGQQRDGILMHQSEYYIDQLPILSDYTYHHRVRHHIG